MKIILIAITLFLTLMAGATALDNAMINELMINMNPMDPYYNFVFYGLWIGTMVFIAPMILWVSNVIAALIIIFTD